MSVVKGPRRCEVCFRPEGDTADGLPPLGTLERCELCNRLACPECRVEGDCCFADWEDHRDDPHWAPKGWRRKPRQTLFDVTQEWERGEGP